MHVIELPTLEFRSFSDQLEYWRDVRVGLEPLEPPSLATLLSKQEQVSELARAHENIRIVVTCK